MESIKNVFSFLAERKVKLNADRALGYIVDTPEEVEYYKRKGKERSVLMQEDIRNAMIQILSNQSEVDWWHALQLQNVLQIPQLKKWIDTDGFQAAVRYTLRNIAADAARDVFDNSTSLSSEEELDVATNTISYESISIKLEILENIAGSELNLD